MNQLLFNQLGDEVDLSDKSMSFLPKDSSKQPEIDRLI